MKIRSAVGRAEFLRLMAVLGDDLPRSIVTMCGFEETRPKVEPLEVPSEMVTGESETTPAERHSPAKPVSLPEVEVRAGERRLTFVRAETIEVLKTPAKDWPDGNPLPVEDLRVPWEKVGPRAPGLMPWRALGSGLRHRLGRWRDGQRLDGRRLEQQWGLGLPVDGLPRLQRMAWLPDLVVLVDRTSESGLFAGDAAALLARLGQERGEMGLHVHWLECIPFEARDLRLPPQAPILVISAMGQLSRSAEVMGEWRRWGRRWSAEGRTLLVLNPAPSRRWNRSLTSIWPTVCWDVHGRVPRYGRMPARGGSEMVECSSDRAACDVVLDLLAPALRITPPLLRRVRMLMGPTADAGLEHDVWHAPEVWRGIDCMGFKTGDAVGSRLQRRSQHPLAKVVGDLAAEFHADCSPGLQWECRLRSILSGGTDAHPVEAVKEFLIRVRDRVRLMVKRGDGTRSWRRSLPTWIHEMTGRLPDEMRGDPRIRECLSETWAWARALSDSEGMPESVTRYPEGLDADVVERVLKEAVELREPRRWRLFRQGTVWRADPPSGELSEATGGTHLGGIQVGQPRLFVEVDREVPIDMEQRTVDSIHEPWGRRSKERFTRQFDSPARTVELIRENPSSRVILASEYERLAFSPLRRPAWATSMSEDRYGLRATFEVRGVSFALRWIPPGSFWMGSPEDEPGRGANEGLRHRVTLTYGFWMGETPVTQEQWRAVVEEAGPRCALDVAPSFFKPRPDLPRPEPYSAQGGLPVESINWTEACAFTRTLGGMLSWSPARDGTFRLPTEAEWEYACRAGTETALYHGPMDLQDTAADALEEIAWYAHNSGPGGRNKAPDVDVLNPQDLRTWRGKGFPIDRAGTRRVGFKKPNGWGLYDMLGNVWEHILDGRRNYEDSHSIDPLGSMSMEGLRVARGGSWIDVARMCRSAFRDLWRRGNRWGSLGFRLCTGQEPLVEGGAAQGGLRGAGAGGTRRTQR